MIDDAPALLLLLPLSLALAVVEGVDSSLLAVVSPIEDEGPSVELASVIEELVRLVLPAIRDVVVLLVEDGVLVARVSEYDGVVMKTVVL